MSYAIVGLLILLVDQFMKFWVIRHVEINAIGKELIPGILRLTHIQNRGMAFGLFSSVPWLRWALLGLLAAFTIFIIVGLATRFLRTGFARWTGLLLLVGLLGNGIERAVFGYAVDMLEPTLFGMNLPIFNLADVLIVVFGILFVIALLAGGIGRPDRDEDYDEPRRRPRPEGEEPRRRPRPEGEEPRRRPRPEGEAPRRRPRPEGEERRPRPRPEGEERRPRPEAAAAAPTVRRVVDADTAPRPAQSQERPVSRREDADVRTVARPAAPKTPAPAPKVEPQAAPKAPASGSDDFDLESILAEFK